jgi:DNA-binding GntR family transcriptional regulator
MLEAAQAAHSGGDRDAQFVADRRFHEALRGFTENVLLREVLEGINNRVVAVRRFAQTKPGPHINESAQEHSAILQAMRERDADRAASLMKAHLDNSARRVSELSVQSSADGFGGG